MGGADMSRPCLEALAQREDLVKKREEAADQWEEALQVWEEALIKRGETADEREAATTVREAAVKKREEMVKERDAAATKREEAARKRQETVKERYAAATKREEDLKKREEAVKERDAAATKREEDLKKREEAVKKRDAAARKWEEAVWKREETVKERDAAATKWEEAVSKREETVKERDAAATMQEEVLHKRREAAKERDALATKRENVIRRQEKALEAMKKREEEKLSKLEQVLKQAEPSKRMRLTAAGSSSLPRQPPPPGPATHIHQLPDEVLAKIFALLSVKTIGKQLSVCRRWHDVIEDRRLIKRLKFEDGTFTTEEALCLISSIQGLKSLELIRRSDDVALLDAASAQCTNLVHLSVDIATANIPFTEALKRVFNTNCHIADLRLKCFSVPQKCRFFQDLGAALPDLCKLELDIRQLSSLQLDDLLNSCFRNQMEEFKASSNPCSEEHIAMLAQVWGRSLRVLGLNARSLTGGALAQLAGCPELRRLNLVGLDTRSDWLNALAALSHLEDLSLMMSCDITGSLCRFFSQSRSSPGLRKIALDGWSGVGDIVLASVAAFCLQLEELQVNGSNLTICGVRVVLRCCCKLHNLDIHGAGTSVIRILPELPQLAPQLRRICFGCNAKRRSAEATLRHVQAQMPYLTIE